MNKQEKTFQFKGETVTVRIDRYQNNKRPAIQLVDSEGFPYATATMNVASNQVNPEFVVIKDYSENRGMYDFLLTNNIVRTAQDFYMLPHGDGAPICVLNNEEDWVMTNQERDPEWFKSDWEDFRLAD